MQYCFTGFIHQHGDTTYNIKQAAVDRMADFAGKLRAAVFHARLRSRR